TAAEIAQVVGGEVLGDGSVTLSGFAPADSARAGDLTFAENENYCARADKSAASAILVAASVSSSAKTLIRVANPRVAFAKVLPLFFPERKFAPGIHPSASISPQARVDPTAHIGAFCAVAEGTQIGPRAILEGGNHVGADCVVGEDSHLSPNVVLYARTQVGDRVRVDPGTCIVSS